MFDLIPWRSERSSGGQVAQRGNDPLSQLRQEFDQLFNRVFGSLVPTEGNETNRWGLDLTSNDKEVVVRAEAPGFEAKDFDVQVTGDVLHIVAEQKASQEKGEQGRWSQTRRLERWVNLPPGTDTEKVEASYRNGVLEIHLPRTPEATGRKIDVKG
jgi:HSP20 family protein